MLLSPIVAMAQNAFNPNISANFLGAWERGTALSDDRTQTPRNGFQLQEAELQMMSDVDPYMKANVLLSISQQDNRNHTTDYGIDPEEVYLESTSLPYVTIRAGKFKMALGKHNMLHTHAFPFIDAPLIHQLVLGDEGLNETGVSAAALIPVSWFSEVTVQAFSTDNEDLYNSPNSGDVAGLAKFKNLFDLTDDLTMEIGVSGTAGQNQFSQTSTVLAGDLTFKWRPSVGGKYRALIWQTEYLNADRPGLLELALAFRKRLSVAWPRGCSINSQNDGGHKHAVNMLASLTRPVFRRKTKAAFCLDFFRLNSQAFECNMISSISKIAAKWIRPLLCNTTSASVPTLRTLTKEPTVKTKHFLFITMGSVRAGLSGKNQCRHDRSRFESDRRRGRRRQVSAESIAKGTQDPHYVEAKPSFMVRANRADLIVSIGLDFEVGWLPSVIQGARNPKIVKGQPGFLEVGPLVDPLEVPKGTVSRSEGDVHPFGNPHITTDPDRMGRVAGSLERAWRNSIRVMPAIIKKMRRPCKNGSPTKPNFGNIGLTPLK